MFFSWSYTVGFVQSHSSFNKRAQQMWINIIYHFLASKSPYIYIFRFIEKLDHARIRLSFNCEKMTIILNLSKKDGKKSSKLFLLRDFWHTHKIALPKFSTEWIWQKNMFLTFFKIYILQCIEMTSWFDEKHWKDFSLSFLITNFPTYFVKIFK